ncbi:aminotransferase class I/II-fold pyridoxal phosphate-dependent enzyme [Streptomyces sp. NPDC050315]|uniref:aminotransferase class I/II-fold pyridoxal phosphate-dependent enzyme n=1 Tax=Streptomyces sp. NPDC050315 TaxID=3155039 RepID=UPI00344A2A86
MERSGKRILRLHTADPVAFGFQPPESLLLDVHRSLADSPGYCHPQGLTPARRAIVQHYRSIGVPRVDIDNVYVGNGASELIFMATQAVLEDGDEVLVPLPSHPLWTGAITMAGGTPVPYQCDEQAGWQPDLVDLARKVTPRTKALLVINPNNPTGAVYDRTTLLGLAEAARRHRLVLFTDEVHDKILFDDAAHIPLATLAPDLLCFTFNGLSKAYRVGGFRAGWLLLTGPLRRTTPFAEALNALAALRGCPNVPAQHAIAPALGSSGGSAMALPGGRLAEQRDLAWQVLNDVGMRCVKPRGALYVFASHRRTEARIADDRRLALDLLRQEHILVAPGSDFGWPAPDRLRLVTLASSDTLTDAVIRTSRFLEEYQQ